jgi:ABC-2 type transport system ATP-binding protein
VPERDSVYAFLTAREFVTASAKLHKLPDPKAAAERALDLVEMAAAADRPIQTYSKGMRQRAKVAAALVHDPQVLLLDEPFNGMDPRQRMHMMDLLRGLGAQRPHDPVLLAHPGGGREARRHGPGGGRRPAGRLRRLPHDPAADDDPAARVPAAQHRRPRAGRGADREPRRAGRELTKDGLEVHASDHGTFTRELAKLSRAAGIGLREVIPSDESLESVFAYLVGA